MYLRIGGEQIGKMTRQLAMAKYPQQYTWQLHSYVVNCGDGNDKPLSVMDVGVKTTTFCMMMMMMFMIMMMMMNTINHQY